MTRRVAGSRRWSRVLVLSLEAWDDVWRRNQHLASRLVGLGYADSLEFVTPPSGGLSLRSSRSAPQPEIEVVTPPLVVPRRLGGHRTIGQWQRRQLRGVDAIWVNDAIAGVQLASTGLPMVYDVTDDWRSMPQSDADRRRLIHAEDVLAERATTVVCSTQLAERWRSRYGVEPILIPNGVDIDAIRSAAPEQLAGRGPHAVYVGTIHPSRIDVALLESLADGWPGTIHLVGPMRLDPSSVDRLRSAAVDIVGAVASTDVPRWLVAADVLVCPHLVDDFTLSLDAIKSYEYLATDRPVIATPSSGFQALSSPGLSVHDATTFVAAALNAVGTGPFVRDTAVDWDRRTASFAAALASARTG